MYIGVLNDLKKYPPQIEGRLLRSVLNISLISRDVQDYF